MLRVMACLMPGMPVYSMAHSFRHLIQIDHCPITLRLCKLKPQTLHSHAEPPNQPSTPKPTKHSNPKLQSTGWKTEHSPNAQNATPESWWLGSALALSSSSTTCIFMWQVATRTNQTPTISPNWARTPAKWPYVSNNRLNPYTPETPCKLALYNLSRRIDGLPISLWDESIRVWGFVLRVYGYRGLRV